MADPVDALAPLFPPFAPSFTPSASSERAADAEAPGPDAPHAEPSPAHASGGDADGAGAQAEADAVRTEEDDWWEAVPHEADGDPASDAATHADDAAMPATLGASDDVVAATTAVTVDAATPDAPAPPAVPDDVVAATAHYDAWCAAYLPLDDAALARKHAAMRADQFQCFRATFYRWTQHWAAHAAHDALAPLHAERAVLAVGDLHVENFGTWRDAEGRLAWGVNDADEAWPLPWPFDLVRLQASAVLAAETGHLDLDAADAAHAIVAGYAEGVEAGGVPFVLAERHAALHRMATARLHEPTAFWDRLAAWPDATTMPRGARKALDRALPAGAEPRYLVRRAGLGALGRPRITALYDWRGGLAAREVKAIVPSAAAWRAGRAASPKDARTRDLLAVAVRAPDPFLDARRRWLVRRLAPDCSRIALTALPRGGDQRALLHAMGMETANVHLGSAGARGLQRGLARVADALGHGWLRRAAEPLLRATRRDWHAWRHAPASDGAPANGAS